MSELFLEKPVEPIKPEASEISPVVKAYVDKVMGKEGSGYNPLYTQARRRAMAGAARIKRR